MPSIELYLGSTDGRLLLDWLRNQPEISFASRSSIGEPRLEGPPRTLEEGQYALFHTSYSRLPVRPAASPQDLSLTDELYSLMGTSPPNTMPRIDENHPAIFNLTVRYSASTLGSNSVGLSSVGWIGGRYESEGLEVTPQARTWWRRLRRWVAANSERVSRLGPLEASSQDLSAYAFPRALEMLRGGARKAANLGD